MYHILRKMGVSVTALSVMLIALCALVAGGFEASAQNTSTLSGRVIDSAGEGLPGATVMVAGTTQGTATNFDGEFSIPNVKVGATVKISFVGCKPQTIVWDGKPLNVTLEDESNTLDEVVVVGFGVQKKVNLSGAVSTVSSKEIQQRPVNSVVDALQGLAPGLDVRGSASGGALNGTRSMNIRGTGTIGTGSSVVPLVLIDGMEGDLNNLNPDDVENISILKDASASSIYGSRAAGGVILVTTKSGKEGKISISYSDSFRWSHIDRAPKMADSWSWAVTMNEASVNSGSGTLITQANLDKLLACRQDPSIPQMVANAGGKWSTWNFGELFATGNTDWIDVHFGKTSFSQEHNVSVSGGTEKFNYYFSGNFLDAGGQLRYGDDKKQRYVVTGKIFAQITKWLDFQYTSRWNRNEYDGPSALNGNTWQNVMRYWPNLPTHDPNGNPIVESYIECFSKGGRNETYDDFTDQQFDFTFKPFDGFSLKAQFNYRNRAYNQSLAYLLTNGYDVEGNAYPNNPNNFGYGNFDNGLYNMSRRENYFNPNIYGTYDFTLNEKNNFTVMAGFQSEWLRRRQFSAERNGLIDNIPFLDMANGDNWSMGGTGTSWSTAGWFGRINYDFDGRYLLEGNLRYDGTSRFRRGSRWSWSPSFSVAWNIAREAFWEDLQVYCNTLKLRGSWGKLSNQNTNNWYPTYAMMGYNPNASGWLVNGTKPTYATQAGLISETLTWEKNRTWDIGLDWGLFNNRLTGTFDYYQRKTEDMVGPGKTVPDVLGVAVPNVNIISMTSKGWELSIGWRDRINDFSYGVSANLYDHQITIDDYPNPTNNLGSPYYPGQKLGQIWGFEVVGLARNNEEMNAHLDAMDAAYIAKNGHAPTTARNGQHILGRGWQGGDIMYKDIDGDGEITQGNLTADNPGDMKIIGNTTPRYSFGLNLDAAYKGFDLRLFFQGVGKRDFYPGQGNACFFGTAGIGLWQAIVFTEHLDYWRGEGTSNPLGPNVDAYYPRPNQGGPNNTYTNTRYMQNAAYCKLKNVTFGYTIPQAFSRKAYIEKARIYFSGENLLTFTNFTKLGDPEMIEAYNAWPYFGKSYPLSRVLSFGLSVTF